MIGISLELFELPGRKLKKKTENYQYPELRLILRYLRSSLRVAPFFPIWDKQSAISLMLLTDCVHYIEETEFGKTNFSQSDLGLQKF